MPQIEILKKIVTLYTIKIKPNNASLELKNYKHGTMPEFRAPNLYAAMRLESYAQLRPFFTKHS